MTARGTLWRICHLLHILWNSDKGTHLIHRSWPGTGRPWRSFFAPRLKKRFYARLSRLHNYLTLPTLRLEITLHTVLHKLIGRNWVISSGQSTFGIRTNGNYAVQDGTMFILWRITDETCRIRRSELPEPRAKSVKLFKWDMILGESRLSKFLMLKLKIHFLPMNKT
jgi:hypothetical protein